MTEIFIIDDEEQIAEMLGEVVTLSGFHANIYSDATVFFEENKHNDHATIILDLNMPMMDGIEVIRKLSNSNCKASLILMSGYDMSVLRSAEKLAQAHGLEIVTSLMKPIQLDSLMEVLKNHRARMSSASTSTEKFEFIPRTKDLEIAIQNDELVIHLQPQIEIETGKLIGSEVLVRWEHPKHGMIFPDSFISLAEESGLIGALTSRVIDLALERISIHQIKGYNIPLSVNVSATNISSLELPEELSDKIQTSNIDPSQLTIELTESALMGELVTSLDILTRIRMKGFSLSIDDFGTGFSSLSQLHRVPFTELKVDKSFVMDMDSDDEAKAIVKTCIVLGHELNMKIVAEGVETQSTFELLKEMGCDIAQGYFLSRPISENDYQLWLDENQHRITMQETQQTQTA